MSGQEGKAEQYLERLGYPHGWHPTQKERLSESIYQRLCAAMRGTNAWSKGQRPKRYKIKPMVHGYVLLPASDIDPARIKYSPFACWMEVLCIGETPYVIPPEQMAKMRQMPDRLREVFEEAERLAEEARRAVMPIVGQPAVVIHGPFQDQKGIVTSIESGRVEIDLGQTIGPVWVRTAYAQRVAS